MPFQRTMRHLFSCRPSCNCRGEGGFQCSLFSLGQLQSRIQNRLALLKILNQLVIRPSPPDWKTATIIPILKPGKPPHLPGSYCPISLTSCLGKVMEKMVNNRLTLHLDPNGLIPKTQAGSTRLQYSRPHYSAGNCSKNRFQYENMIGAIFLDITSTYDKTWHPGLLVKLTRLKVTGNSLLWIRNLLHHRSFQVRIYDGCTSSLRHLKGVPQGSTLSPTLFNIALADFPEPPEGCHLSLYADVVAPLIPRQHQPYLSRTGFKHTSPP